MTAIVFHGADSEDGRATVEVPLTGRVSFDTRGTTAAACPSAVQADVLAQTDAVPVILPWYGGR